MRIMLVLLCGAVMALLSPLSANAQQPIQTINEQDCAGVGADGKPLGPGDEKYMHKCLHESYKEMYAGAKCHCYTGYCRPTQFRTHEGERQVLISGHWYDVPDASLRGRNQIPEQLWHQPGHMCARPTGKMLPDGRPEQDIECTVDNATG